MSRNDGYSSARRRSQRRRGEGRRSDRAERMDRAERSERRERESRKAHPERQRSRERRRGAQDGFQKSKRALLRELREFQQGFQKEISKVLQQEELANEIALRDFRTAERTCPVCGRPISAEDMDCAVSDRKTGGPAHFDCVLKQVGEGASTGRNEKITYIGQGKFAVLYFENPGDLRHFSIRRTIEWESRDSRQPWRGEMAGLFSQTR